MPKMIFVAHPMSGDVEGNTKKVIDICRSLHSEEFIPVFPSLLWREYLKGDGKKKLIRAVTLEYFKRGFIDELWLYGPTLTDGMKYEIQLAIKYNIPVIAKTIGTQHELGEYFVELADLR